VNDVHAGAVYAIMIVLKDRGGYSTTPHGRSKQQYWSDVFFALIFERDAALHIGNLIVHTQITSSITIDVRVQYLTPGE